MSKEIEDILEERGDSYGDFGVNIEAIATIMKELNHVHRCKNVEDLNLIDHMSLQYQVIKLVRLGATPAHLDSWKDLQGYAKLSEEYYAD